MTHLLKIIAIAFLGFLIWFSSSIFVQFYFKLWLSHKFLSYFCISFVAALILFWKVLSSGSFYSTLRHELCHWFFAVLSFNRPAALNIHTDGGGNYSYYGRRNYFIVLAPYFFPIVSIALLLISVFFGKPTSFFYIVMGVTLAFDTISMVKDYHPGQSDWHNYGVGFSVIFSIAMYVLCVLAMLVVLFNGWTVYWQYIKQIVSVIWSFFF